MKMKLRLDAESIKQMGIDHAEKLAFGLVVLGFVGFVLSAMGRERLDFGPEKLAQEAQEAKQNLDRPRSASVTIPDFATQTDRIREQVPPKPFVSVNPLNGVIKETKLKRPVPPIELVQGLRGTYGQGAFAMGSEEESTDVANVIGGAAQLRGQRWIVLTGKIPHAAQVDKFTQAFENTTLRTQADYPDYIYPRIERAEVDPRLGDTVDPKELKWEKLNVNQALAMTGLWTGSSQEVGDPQCLAPRQEVCFPLGPLQDRPWGREVVYPPDIALLADIAPTMGEGGGPGTMMSMGPMGSMAGRPKKKADAEAKAEESGEEAAAAPKPRKRPRRPAMTEALPDDPMVEPSAGGAASGEMAGPMGARPRRMSGPASGPMGPMMSPMMSSRPTMPPGGYRGPGGMRSGMGEGPGMGGPGYMGGPGMAGYGEEEFEEPKFLLFRFFDFTVKPGKSYRYRVRLVLANPNNGLNAQFLQDEAQSKKRWLEDPNAWSSPTPVVRVPMDSQMLLVSAKDKEADVLMVHFNQEDGTIAHTEKQVTRGQWLDYKGVAFTPPAPRGGYGGGMMSSMPGMSGPAGRNAEETEEIKIDYLTNCLVLDWQGGGKLPGKEKERLIEPASVLLLDPYGNLVCRNELDDLPEVQLRLAADAQAEPTVGQSMMTGDMPNPSMMYNMGKGAKGGRRTSSSPMMGPPSSSPMDMLHDGPGKGRKSGRK